MGAPQSSASLGSANPKGLVCQVRIRMLGKEPATLGSHIRVVVALPSLYPSLEGLTAFGSLSASVASQNPISR